jgi:3-oxoacyl-[acyl-carrier-protein] synthase II (EC 2.3.1.41)
MQERIVITGMGAVTPIGIGVADYWRALVGGKGGVGRITRFPPDGLPCQIGAEVKGFAPENYLSKKLVKETDPFAQYAIAAMQMAIQESGLDLSAEDPYRRRGSAGYFHRGDRFHCGCPGSNHPHRLDSPEPAFYHENAGEPGGDARGHQLRLKGTQCNCQHRLRLRRGRGRYGSHVFAAG